LSDIEQKLATARAKAEGYGNLYGRKETADDFLKTTYAVLYEDAEGNTVPEKDAWVRRQPKYFQAIERKKDAYSNWKTAETYMKILFAEAEVWRTQQANNRLMDGAHR